jgi:hypothetical protein
MNRPADIPLLLFFRELALKITNNLSKIALCEHLQIEILSLDEQLIFYSPSL